MEAPRNWACRSLGVSATFSLAWLLTSASLQAAGYRTTNFTVDAPTPQLAKEIGDTAEYWRRKLADEWLGRELPNWSRPCPIKAQVASKLGAGGATSFVFDHGEVFDWRMNIQGSRERILDSVLPHEVTHTIFASHFRQPLPRWADEGACTTVEHQSEVAKQERMLIDFLRTRRGIAMSDMFAMTEYPSDVLPLYAQGHSVARFLIDKRGKRAFLNFLADGMQDGNWPRALKEHYEYDHLLALQNSWMDWIRAGRPPIQPAGDVLLASAQAPTPAPEAKGSVAAAMGPLVNGQPAAAARDREPAASSPSRERPASQAQAEWAPVTPTPGSQASLSGPPQANAAASVYDASRDVGAIRR